MIGMDTYYASMADAIARGPQLYGGDASLVSLRCFQRYTKTSTTDISTPFGAKWVTRPQARVQAVLLRVAVGSGRTTMAAVALECGVVTSTVSRAILKLQSWGVVAVDVRRGRNGGITVWKPTGDRFAAYVAAARQTLGRLASAARARSIKLAFTLRESGSELISRSVVMDASFTGRVLYERAYLALSDPEGEHDPAVLAPLLSPEDIERGMILAADVRRRHLELMMEAAKRNDWGEWSRLRDERP